MFSFEEYDFSSSMEQGELPKAVTGYKKVLEPPLPKADEQEADSPQTGDDKMEGVDASLASDDDKEFETEQPSVARKDELDDVEPKDHDVEHSLAEPINQRKVEPPTVGSDVIDVESPLARNEENVAAGKLYSFGTCIRFLSSSLFTPYFIFAAFTCITALPLTEPPDIFIDNV
jgi:hypothetical protein